MPTPQSVKRRKSFRMALIAEGITQNQFADRVGVTRQHVWLAFSRPELVSQRIHDAIDALIEKHGQSVAA